MLVNKVNRDHFSSEVELPLSMTSCLINALNERQSLTLVHPHHGCQLPFSKFVSYTLCSYATITHKMSSIHFVHP